MQENGRRDSPQDDRVNDKKDDLACAMDVKNVKEYDVDGDRIPFYWPPFRKGPPNIFLPHKPAQMEGGRRKVSPPDHYDRVTIEWCCGRNSMLGKSSKHSSGGKVVRLTIDDDLRTSEGLQKAIRVLQDCPRGRTLLWSSMPCAGGSPWQTLNAATGEGLGKIEGRWRDFRLLWSNFEFMARAVMDVGGEVVIEWPERCKYWADISVMRFVKQHSFVDSMFHGYACGLVTKHNMPIGRPMKKPWRSSSNDPIMVSFLNRKCQGGHDHVECRGRDCKASEDYTPAVIDAAHAGFL
jgi:hypothetical protein